jgi:uncharacterized membrane-anchored protein
MPVGRSTRLQACFGLERTLSIHTIVTRRRELFYWGAILLTFALGTAAGADLDLQPSVSNAIG